MYMQANKLLKTLHCSTIAHDWPGANITRPGCLPQFIYITVFIQGNFADDLCNRINYSLRLTLCTCRIAIPSMDVSRSHKETSNHIYNALRQQNCHAKRKGTNDTNRRCNRASSRAGV